MNKKKKIKSNHEYKAPPAYMGHGKQSMSLSVERTSFSVYIIVKKILEIKSNRCLLGRNIKIIFLSQKLEILDNGNTRIKYFSIFLLKIGIGVQWERAELQTRGKHRCNPSHVQVLPPAG